MNAIIMLVIFVVATLVGYKIINNVPSLLHTPLMSGMNALSGITVLGALTSTAAAAYLQSTILGVIAIFLAMLNVAGGFNVTHLMLKMFKKGGNKNG